MKSEIIDKETEKAMVRFNEICNEYLKKFGENSLERIIFHDPMILDINNFKEDTKMLKDAIKNNKPLEQIQEEMWKNMIF